MSTALTQIASRDDREAAQQAFREERRTGIGGSDIHHVFSLEPYGCARKLFYEKTATPPDYASKNEDLFERGHELEPVIIAKYMRETGREGRSHPATVRNPRHPELFAHLDHLIRTDDGKIGVLEAKSANREVYSKVKREGLQQGYVLQVQHAIHTAREEFDVEFGTPVVLWPDGWKMLHWDVEYDAELGSLIEEESLRFWARVQADDIPDRLPAKDKRCKSCEFRTSCQGAAMLEGVEDSGNDDVPYLDDASELVEEYFEWSAISKEAEEHFEEVKDRLRLAMDAHAAADAPGARIYYRPHEKKTVDGQSLAKKYQELRILAVELVRGNRSSLDSVAQLAGAMPEEFLKQVFPDPATFNKTSVVRPLKVYAK